MMRFQSYFNTALLLIGQYTGTEPFANYTKKYFAQHKKHGSNDRKQIVQLCYGYFRLGHSFPEETPAQRLTIAIFLMQPVPGNWLFLFKDAWLENWLPSLDVRIAFIQKQYASFAADSLFPWMALVGESVEKTSFGLSHLIQPNLFLRIRPNREKQVLQKLEAASFSYEREGLACLSLPNASKVEAILTLNRDVVIQDYSSQRITELLSLVGLPLHRTLSVWDCCAASGGKSILAVDTLQKVQLTVSDIRPSILQNLKQRFTEAGVSAHKAFTANLSLPLSAKEIPGQGFDLVICDAPCTGSGTWGRTPEQLCFFEERKIGEYASLQQKILKQVIPAVTNGGYLLYITCSVFTQENEDIAQWVTRHHPEMVMVKKELLKGYDRKADTLFAVLFNKVI